MDVFRIRVPAMYGDHHVIEVRALLLGLEGVVGVYASSGLQLVEVQVDPGKIGQQEVISALEKAGYLQESNVPTESGLPAYGRKNNDTFFRHTAAFEQSKQIVSFRQKVGFQGRALWPCPGMGVINKKEVMDNE